MSEGGGAEVAEPVFCGACARFCRSCGADRLQSAQARARERGRRHRGGVIARGLGIPRVRLSGGPLELTIVPFRVLDPNSHTVKPRLGQIKNAVNAWWAMTAPDSQ